MKTKNVTIIEPFMLWRANLVRNVDVDFKLGRFDRLKISRGLLWSGRVTDGSAHTFRY